ncbi:MAG: hypothetical protein GX051_03095, partial [Clostridiales bacterium]|nr:hypothetical protein [Clostridiales bacterium]
KSDYYGKCVFASSGSNKYLLDFNGKTIFTYSEQPQPVLNLPNSSLVKTTALANGRVCFGVADKSGKTIVPCEYYQLSLIGKTRIYVQQGYPGGFEAGDKAAIYDTDGKIVCPYGRFLGIQYKHDYKSGTTASTGIAYELNDGGKAPELCYLVNQDGKKLTGAYESLNANDDGSFTAVKDGKTVTLTADGKVA